MHGPFRPKGDLCHNSGAPSWLIWLALEQGSDLLSSEINNGFVKTRMQRGAIYSYPSFIFWSRISSCEQMIYSSLHSCPWYYSWCKCKIKPQRRQRENKIHENQMVPGVRLIVKKHVLYLLVAGFLAWSMTRKTQSLGRVRLSRGNTKGDTPKTAWFREGSPLPDAEAAEGFSLHLAALSGIW